MFDNWCKFRPLAKRVTPRDVSNAGFNMSCRVADFVVNGEWHWPLPWLMKAPNIGTLPAPSLDPNTCGLIQWKNRNGVLSSFSVSRAWHAFHLWLTLGGSLRTQDKIHQWDVGDADLSMLRCPLCDVETSPSKSPPPQPRLFRQTTRATTTTTTTTTTMAEAFKRAAESLEKLLYVTRQELPHTMAEVRLSGMQISDLTIELSDLGQEITQGVKSSTRAVRLAEERLRRLTNMNPSGFEIDDNLGRQVTAFQLLSFMKIPKLALANIGAIHKRADLSKKLYVLSPDELRDLVCNKLKLVLKNDPWTKRVDFLNEAMSTSRCHVSVATCIFLLELADKDYQLRGLLG
ncbi:hypothetical protein Tco_0031477 [Tanacetum coccineum]